MSYVTKKLPTSSHLPLPPPSSPHCKECLLPLLWPLYHACVHACMHACVRVLRAGPKVAPTEVCKDLIAVGGGRPGSTEPSAATRRAAWHRPAVSATGCVSTAHSSHLLQRRTGSTNPPGGKSMVRRPDCITAGRPPLPVYNRCYWSGHAVDVCAQSQACYTATLTTMARLCLPEQIQFV